MNRKIIAVLILIAILIIGIVIWKSSDTVTDSGGVKIVKLTSSTKGDYSPKVIKVKAGTKVRIEADPNTLTGSMGTLIIDELNLSKEITSGDNVLEFIADKKGKYRMHCANGMGNGTLIVE